MKLPAPKTLFSRMILVLLAIWLVVQSRSAA